jgi:hypothetical protein
MLTRDEVIQLILYLILATVLLLAGRARAEDSAFDKAVTVAAGMQHTATAR